MAVQTSGPAVELTKNDSRKPLASGAGRTEAVVTPRPSRPSSRVALSDAR